MVPKILLLFSRRTTTLAWLDWSMSDKNVTDLTSSFPLLVSGHTSCFSPFFHFWWNRTSFFSLLFVLAESRGTGLSFNSPIKILVPQPLFIPVIVSTAHWSIWVLFFWSSNIWVFSPVLLICESYFWVLVVVQVFSIVSLIWLFRFFFRLLVSFFSRFLRSQIPFSPFPHNFFWKSDKVFHVSKMCGIRIFRYQVQISSRSEIVHPWSFWDRTSLFFLVF